MMRKYRSTRLGEVTLLEQIGKGKSGYSYLAELNGHQVVFKQMHNEPCSYYTFSDDKVRLEMNAHKILKEIGIPIPELLIYDLEEQYLVKSYVNGVCGHKWVAANNSDDTIIRQLFSISELLKAHNLNIDYFPPNFVIAGEVLYYVDYEINEFSDDWSLENWGIYYWANNAGLAEYIHTGDWHHINETINSGVPVKKPFEEKVNQWISKFGHQKKLNME